ncbi:hypothetical protein [Symbiopectobacterium sp. RP]|uniref:hypothetical protein n=1 Tax=Symbiopectobacterium sp. RP TaxID=3248553 RepID=UPI003D2B98FE
MAVIIFKSFSYTYGKFIGRWTLLTNVSNEITSAEVAWLYLAMVKLGCIRLFYRRLRN